VNGAASISAAPDMMGSFLRMGGALLLVLGLFLTGVWLFRNWQRLALRNGTAPRLNVLEVKSLGQRQAIYVVGYQQQRMLVATSPAGVTLLSHLPEADAEELKAAPVTRLSFAEAFQHVLARKQS
jgi:flagellar biogenesis protein FliO